jgi:hypothetical protein
MDILQPQMFDVRSVPIPQIRDDQVLIKGNRRTRHFSRPVSKLNYPHFVAASSSIVLWYVLDFVLIFAEDLTFWPKGYAELTVTFTTENLSQNFLWVTTSYGRQ